jgi:hypothetical protein
VVDAVASKAPSCGDGGARLAGVVGAAGDCPDVSPLHSGGHSEMASTNLVPRAQTRHSRPARTGNGPRVRNDASERQEPRSESAAVLGDATAPGVREPCLRVGRLRCWNAVAYDSYLKPTTMLAESKRVATATPRNVGPATGATNVQSGSNWRTFWLTSLRFNFSLRLSLGVPGKADSRRSTSARALPVSARAARRHRRLDFVRGIWEARRHDLVTAARNHDHVFEIEAVAVNGEHQLVGHGHSRSEHLG